MGYYILLTHKNDHWTEEADCSRCHKPPMTHVSPTEPTDYYCQECKEFIGTYPLPNGQKWQNKTPHHKPKSN